MRKTYWKFIITALVVQMAQVAIYKVLGIYDQISMTPVISVAIGLQVAGVLK